MGDLIFDQGYIFIKCGKCGDRVKIAKNKGGYFKTGYDTEWLQTFLSDHGECDINQIEIIGEP